MINQVFRYLESKDLVGWLSHKLYDDWKERLDKMLGSKLNDIDRRRIKNAINAVESLKNLIGE